MKRAILQLQRALARRFGTKVGTVIGQASLTIAHDRVELTNEGCVIIARGPVKVVRVLRRVSRGKRPTSNVQRPRR